MRLLLTALLLSGCVSTQPLDLSDPAQREALAERAAAQPAYLVLLDGSVADAHALRVDADSASWLDEAGRVQAVPRAEVVRVSFRGEDPRRGLSGGQGAAAGALAGGLALGLLSAATFEPNLVFGRASWTAGAAALGAVLGAGTGAVAASGRLRPERYVVTPSPVPR